MFETSIPGLRPSNIETEVIQQREIVGTSSQGLSSFSQARPGKRIREVGETSSEEDPIALDTKSPLAKRHRGWYKMIRGRQPIRRVQDSRVTSPRGVSAEKQVFSQGSLTVGDMVLPLPARAHQSKE